MYFIYVYLPDLEERLDPGSLTDKGSAAVGYTIDRQILYGISQAYKEAYNRQVAPRIQFVWQRSF